jgi:histidine ammonia-lyase
MSIIISGNDLTMTDIWSVAVEREKIELDKSAAEKVEKCRQYVEKIVKENKAIYGLTTGFGKFSNVRIPTNKIAELQNNLILSHATGVGKILSIPETRAVMLLRINVLAKGHSGIRLNTLQTLIDMLNAGIHPCIPEKGSVGASGDLAPLSHLALVLLGKGEAEFQGKMIRGSLAMKKANLKPVYLEAKEGLALNNGTQVMTAVLSLILLQAEKLCKQAEIIAATSIEALLGTITAFDPLVHSLRPYPGQSTSAANIFNLLQNSELNQSHCDCENVQDAYSIRCTPQVVGAVRDVLVHVRKILETEINSATDNPLIFPEEDKVISGGNFHGEPIAFAADMLGMAVSELGNISDRRMEHILNPALNRGLKPFLAPRPGLDSGFMIAQVTAAALCSENKVLSHPSSVDSIPTSANQEDHVSMGMTGVLKAKTILENVTHILSIELMIAVQALDYRSQPSSQAIEAVRAFIRKHVKTLEKDRQINHDMAKIWQIIDSGELINIVSEFIRLQ